MSYTATELAKYVINKCTQDGHPVSNLQLQSILYHVQKSFLESGAEAFADEMEAWPFGPVVPSVYYRYCGFGAMPIRMRYETHIEEPFLWIVDPIIDDKRRLHPWEMAKDVQPEGKAWAEIFRNGVGNHQVIPRDLIRKQG